MSKWKEWRRNLQDLGGWENELVGVPAGAVRKMIEEGESLEFAYKELFELAQKKDREIAELRSALRRNGD